MPILDYTTDQGYTFYRVSLNFSFKQIRDVQSFEFQDLLPEEYLNLIIIDPLNCVLPRGITFRKLILTADDDNEYTVPFPVNANDPLYGTFLDFFRFSDLIKKFKLEGERINYARLLK